MGLLSKIDDNDIIGKVLRTSLALYPYKLRKLKEPFTSFTKTLIENEKKSFEEIQNYQFQEFKTLVTNAYNHSKFYKDFYDQKGFEPSELKVISDITKVPIISKVDIRDNYSDLVLDTYKGKILKSVTSGTTGSALTILRDEETAIREWASICYQWYRIGYTDTDGRIELRGVLNKGEITRKIAFDKVMRINILEMNEYNIEEIMKAINASKYKFLHGYPSAIVKFFKIVKAKYQEFPSSLKLKGIMIASEVLYDWQIDFIEAFCPKSIKIIAHYGQAEKVALGAWSRDKKYHFIPSYSLVEFNNEKQIIGTSFICKNIPLIRYQMKDRMEDIELEPIGEKCLYPVVGKIVGRLEDITYNNKNEEVPPAIVTFAFKKLEAIKACRLIQNKLFEFDLEYEVANSDKKNLKEELNFIETRLKFIYGEKSNVNFIKMDSFEDLKNGKFRWIINKM